MVRHEYITFTLLIANIRNTYLLELFFLKININQKLQLCAPLPIDGDSLKERKKDRKIVYFLNNSTFIHIQCSTFTN